MPRNFGKITKKELEEKILKAVEDGGNVYRDVDEPKHFNLGDHDVAWELQSLTKKVSSDLSKVGFDAENISSDYAYGWSNQKDNLIGLQELPNGMVFLGVNAGGDWETPIFFIIYWSGKELRGYIPTKGNTWNKLNNSAMGNDEEKDAEYRKSKGIPRDFYLAFVQGELIDDITSRIKPLSEKVTKTPKKPKVTARTRMWLQNYSKECLDNCAKEAIGKPITNKDGEKIGKIVRAWVSEEEPCVFAEFELDDGSNDVKSIFTSCPQDISLSCRTN